MKKQVEQVQPHLLEHFNQVLTEHRLSHAYLFSGHFGSLTLALYLAQSRFCEDLSADQSPCGKCRPCRLIAGNEFSDVTIIEPQGQTIKTEQIREVLSRFSQSGYESSRQVFIIKEADKMHPNASNRLLKQIEEPTADYYVFLLTSDASKVLPTIRSRCQLVEFPVNRNWVQEELERAGLLRQEARILKDLVDQPEDIESLAKNKKVLETLSLGQRFLDRLQTAVDQAYLMIPALLSQAPDKADQDQLLQILSLQVAQLLPREKAMIILEGLGEIRRMWQANVSLQNCLDYLVLTMNER